MEQLIYDIEKIAHISSIKLYSYLEKNGWEKRKEVEGISVWTYKKKDEVFGIFVPFNENFVDYKNRVFEVLCTLEKVEGRPFSKIVDSLQSASTLAQAMHREIIEMRVRFQFEEKYDISAKKIGHVLKSLQDFFDSLGELKLVQRQTGLKNSQLKGELEVSLIETFQGSFGFRLGFAPQRSRQTNLFDSPIAEDVSQDFLELIKASSNAEFLKKRIALYRGKSSIKYKTFLSNLLLLDASLYLEWGSANPEKGGVAEISYEHILQAFDIVSKQEIENPTLINFTGRLILAGSDSKRKNTRFIVIDLNDPEQKEYKGHISPLVINSSVELTIGKTFKISLQENHSINRATGNEEITYTMIGLERI